MTVPPVLGLMAQGTTLLLDAAADRPHLAGPSHLPGWTRRHVVAHLAANAQALSRLATWARTGVEHPMYASADQRLQEIEDGAKLRDPALHSWLLASAEQLSTDLGALDDAAWAAEVVTAQGRTVPATVIPWLRCREVFIHLVDLNLGVEFADLPEPFLERLVADVVAQRTARGEDRTLMQRSGSLSELAGWLTGRLPAPPQTSDAAPAPALPAWL